MCIHDTTAFVRAFRCFDIALARFVAPRDREYDDGRRKKKTGVAPRPRGVMFAAGVEELIAVLRWMISFSSVSSVQRESTRWQCGSRTGDRERVTPRRAGWAELPIDTTPLPSGPIVSLRPPRRDAEERRCLLLDIEIEVTSVALAIQFSTTRRRPPAWLAVKRSWARE
jgi:hypothetical protein